MTQQARIETLLTLGVPAAAIAGVIGYYVEKGKKK
jgi:hypothetical protein